MAGKKAKENIKDLKNIGSFDKQKLAGWGVTGAIVLFIWALVSTILTNVIDIKVWWLLGLIGLVLGILYLVLGVFGIISTIKSQEKQWGFFLAGSILAVLAPLAWYGYAGLAIAIIAGVMFFVFKKTA